MTFHATEGACAFAWRNYLLVHSGIREDDHRRSALHRYLTDLGDAGDFDFDRLQIAAVSYLKSLDELHDDRAARLAADRELAKRAHSRALTPEQRNQHDRRNLEACPFTARTTKKHQRRCWKGYECLETNNAVPSLNAEDVGGQHRKARWQIQEGL